VLDITIAIPVRNEAKNLPACLAAIGSDFAAQIVVIDSGSIDETAAIARQHGATVLDFTWDGHFPKKRNWFLRNHRPVTRWVLFLDADEFITPEFKDDLRRILPTTSLVGYWIPYTIYFLGKKLKGGYPLHKLALFRVGAGEYERIDEAKWSQLDMEVHEHPVLEGTIGTIHSRIDHRDFRDLSHYIAKHNDYSSWEAHRVIQTKPQPSWTWKQRLKYRVVRSPLAGPVYFVGSYFFMGGFRDGATGLAFALIKAGYFTQVYCKMRELRQLADQNE